MALKKVVAKVKNQDLVEKKHLQIAEAAGELFSKKGFHKTTMREISKASGIELSYLYKYISSKNDILFLFYRHVQKLYNHVYQSLSDAKDNDPVKLLEDLIASIFDLSRKYRRELLTIYTESRHLKADSLQTVLSIENEMIRLLEDLIIRGVKEGCFHTEDPFMAANIIQHVLVLEATRGWNFRDRYSQMSYVKPVANFIMRALGVHEERRQTTGNRKSKKKKRRKKSDE